MNFSWFNSKLQLVKRALQRWLIVWKTCRKMCKLHSPTLQKAKEQEKLLLCYNTLFSTLIMFVLPPRFLYSPRLRVVSTKLIIKLIKTEFLLSSSLPRSRPFFLRPSHRLHATTKWVWASLWGVSSCCCVGTLSGSCTFSVDDETWRLLREEAKKGSGKLIFQLITRRVQF